MSYVFIEFPKWKYHAQKEALIVDTKEQEDALGPEWRDLPVSSHSIKIQEKPVSVAKSGKKASGGKRA